MIEYLVGGLILLSGLFLGAWRLASWGHERQKERAERYARENEILAEFNRHIDDIERARAKVLAENKKNEESISKTVERPDDNFGDKRL